MEKQAEKSKHLIALDGQKKVVILPTPTPMETPFLIHQVQWPPERKRCFQETMTLPRMRGLNGG